MRLNLGCGSDVRDGYVNVDFRPGPGVTEVDLSILPWPWSDGSADEILMLDFLEHFPYAKTQSMLLECYRVLAPGGELVIQVPDGEHLALAFSQLGEYLCNRCGNNLIGGREDCKKCGQSRNEISEAAMMRLYGGQNYVGNTHYTCFTKRSLWIKSHACGFVSMQLEEEDHQFLNWNFLARLKKGDLW